MRINKFLNKELEFGELRMKVIEKMDKYFIIIRHNNYEEEIVIDDMLMFLFPFCDEKYQERLIPTKTHRSRILFQQLSVKAHKDIKKGEIINVMNKLSVPEEMLCVSSGKGLIVPR